MFESVIQSLIANTEIVILIAFLLGVLTSISPCPLATNIAAVAYISRNVKNPKHAVLNGVFYTLGRIFTYSALGAGIILIGISAIDVSLAFQSLHGRILGAVMVAAGVLMLGIININFNLPGGSITERLSRKAAGFGLLGAFFIGVLFALAFCPYSAILFFGTLIPLGLASNEGVILPLFYGLGTGVPVLLFAGLFYFGAQGINRHVQNVSRFEKILRKFIGVIFIVIGLYMVFT
jgi:cytochrome c biogenesis protein CcdA